MLKNTARQGPGQPSRINLLAAGAGPYVGEVRAREDDRDEERQKDGEDATTPHLSRWVGFGDACF